MSEAFLNLKRFRARVRWLRAWRGLAVGLCLGAVLATVWAVLDWRGVLYAEWLSLGLLAFACGVMGALVGACLKVSERDLARSLDRRAGLKDRATTALEPGVHAFEEPLRADAALKIAELKPREVFPTRFGRWQFGAMASCLLAASIFLLGNTPILLNEDAKKNREELKKAGEAVERVNKENEKPDAKANMNADEKRLANELMKLERDLDKARMSKEQMLQKGNELNQEAEKLTRDRADQLQKNLISAESAFQKLQKEQEASTMNLQESPELAAKQAQLAEVQKDVQATQAQIDALQNQFQRGGLSKEQQQDLQKTLKDLKGKLASKQALALKLSKEVKDMLERMKRNPIYKEIQEMLAKMQQDAKAASQNPSQQQLTKEQIAEMERKLEELAKLLKDDKAMEEFLKRMKEALKDAKACENCAQAAFCMSCLLGTRGGIPNASHGGTFADTGKINTLDHSVKSEGKTNATQVTGQKRNTGKEAYVEIKAPTMVGNRSSVPYQRVLPSYQRKAEQAIDRQEIPKEHQKRVKEYFEGLSK